ncbi:MAG: hypothetical protein QMC50_03615 [Candidatus Poseidoniaceae archaeon]|jgi:hypothetical protein|tara:strand:+ start:260 stop:565 length:306 start_codon:yes stop_codon:yes gene_type:complete
MFRNAQQNRMGGMLWYAVLIWFSSSILSQALFIGFYGAPYDAIDLLGGIGPAYIGLILIEVTMWIILAGLSVVKMARKLKLRPVNIVPNLGNEPLDIRHHL